MLHAAPDGTTEPAHICRGAGSFEAAMRQLGEPLPADYPAAPAAPPPAEQAQQAQHDLPQAATVS